MHACGKPKLDPYCELIDPAEIEHLFAELDKGKEALLDSNRKALAMGRDYALANFVCPLTLRVERRDKVGNRIFIDGNSAAALGAVSSRRPEGPAARSV